MVTPRRSHNVEQLLLAPGLHSHQHRVLPDRLNLVSQVQHSQTLRHCRGPVLLLAKLLQRDLR
eukprot:406454-Hanusia_phi.AAC.1